MPRKMVDKAATKRLLPIKEAAVMLGRPVYGVRELLWRHELPAVRSGRSLYIDVLDIEEWIAKHKKFL